MTKKPLITFDTVAGVVHCDIQPDMIAPQHKLIIRFEKELGLSIRAVANIPVKNFAKTSHV